MARSGGLFGWFRDAIETIVDAITPNREPEPAPREAPSEQSGGDGGGGDYVDNPTGNETTLITENDAPPGQENFPFDFQLAGFQELDLPTKDYVNLEGETVYLEFLPWSNMDYFVIKVQEPGKDPYYTTIAGSFEDYDDLLYHIEQWWEEGS